MPETSNPPAVVARHDWHDFLDPEGLRRKAGWSDLVTVALKELADNAADAGTATVERLSATSVCVADDGPGLDPEAVTALFDVKRGLVTSKDLGAERTAVHSATVCGSSPASLPLAVERLPSPAAACASGW